MQTLDLFDAGIPKGLKSLNNWVLWRLEERDGKQTKVPYSAKYRGRASSTDCRSWSSYEEAMLSLSSRDSGLGVVIDKASRIVFIDVDHCITEGAFDERGLYVLNVFEGYPAYIELSQSGTGLHVLALGEIPKSFKSSAHNVEMYDHARFCALTGKALSTEDIGEAQPAIDYVFNKYRPPEKAKHIHSEPAAQTLKKSDRWIVERAAAHGGKFRDLYAGHFEQAGYGSHSEADAALCTILAFWSDGDTCRIDRMFRSSGLYRPKWERRDYRERTIRNAIDHCGETFSGFVARANRERGQRLEQIYRTQW